MLKCTMCGKVVRCCHVLCPECAEPMVSLEDYEREKALFTLEKRVGDPIYPEALKTQCKMCGRRTPLFILTDYNVGGKFNLGICKECHFAEYG